MSQRFLRGARKLTSRCRDVVAFVKQGTEPRIGVISDNIDDGLADFMRKVITEYGGSPRRQLASTIAELES